MICSVACRTLPISALSPQGQVTLGANVCVTDYSSNQYNGALNIFNITTTSTNPPPPLESTARRPHKPDCVTLPSSSIASRSARIAAGCFCRASSCFRSASGVPPEPTSYLPVGQTVVQERRPRGRNRWSRSGAGAGWGWGSGIGWLGGNGGGRGRTWDRDGKASAAHLPAHKSPAPIPLRQRWGLASGSLGRRSSCGVGRKLTTSRESGPLLARWVGWWGGGIAKMSLCASVHCAAPGLRLGAQGQGHTGLGPHR